jgi:hypothetical protein
LTKLRPFELFFQFGLARKHDLQEFLRGSFQVVEQPNLFQHGHRQILGFIDHQYCGLALLGAFQKPMLEDHQHVRLVRHVVFNSKVRHHEVE